MITWKRSFDAFIVYLLLFASGSHVFKLAADQLIVVLFLFLFCVWYLRTDRKFNVKFVLYLVGFSGFLFIVSLYTGGSLSLASVIGSAIKLSVAYLILKIVGARFSETYIKVVVFLAVVSLFGYATDIFHLFDGLITKLPRVGNKGYEGFLYVYRFRWHIDRNNSIFFEPGAYQIFLNTALFLLLLTKTSFSSSRFWSYILILFVTLVTTFSTTGFLIFAVIFGLFLLLGDRVSGTGKITMVGLVFAVVVAFSAQFYSVIFEKLENFTNIEHITDSADRRGFDTLVDIEIIKKNVFGLGYDKYFKEFSATGLTEEGESTSSNGITKLFAVYGLPFGLFLLASFYWALNKLLDGFVLTISAFGMLVMFLIGESYYIFAPFCLAIIAAPFVYKPMEVNKSVESDAGKLI